MCLHREGSCRVSSGWVTTYSNSSFGDTILSWKLCHPVTVCCKARAVWAGTTTDTSWKGGIFTPRSLFNVNWALVLKCWINQEVLESNYCQVCWRHRWYFKTTEETDQEFCKGLQKYWEFFLLPMQADSWGPSHSRLGYSRHWGDCVL